jgi:hypothetical protein
MSFACAKILSMISGLLLVAQAPLVYRQDRNRASAFHAPRIGTASRAGAPRGVRGIACSGRGAHAACMHHPVASVTRAGGHPL